MKLIVKFYGVWIKLRFIYLKIKNKNTLSIGFGTIFYGLPLLIFTKGSSVSIGNNVIIRSHSMYNPLGLNHPTIFSTLSSTASIIICDDVGMSGCSICSVERITIGKRTLLGANVKIMDTDFHQLCPQNRIYENIDKANSKSVVIGEDVFIGANAIILKGVTIGNGSVIGAGSVVSNCIPENVVAAGNPCKVIKKIDEQCTS